MEPEIFIINKYIFNIRLLKSAKLYLKFFIHKLCCSEIEQFNYILLNSNYYIYLYIYKYA